jgi:hypothetical protein
MKTILILLTLTVSATAADRYYTVDGRRVRCIDAPRVDTLPLRPPAPPAATTAARIEAPPQAAIPSAVAAVDQSLFVAAVDKWRSAFEAGANDMAKGAARPARARDLCNIVRNRSIIGWIGTVTTLSSNNDGKGVLAMKIGRDIELKTWNNSFSDLGDRTLLEPGTGIFQRATVLRKGQRVAVSGAFIASDTDCVRETSLTITGSMTEPEFLLRFTDIAPID